MLIMEESLKKRKDWIKNKLFGWVKDNYDKAFIGVLIIAFILRFIIFLKTMDQTMWYDATSYLSTAKIWGLGLDINDLWYYRRGFFWPLFGAFFFKIGLGEKTIRFTEVLFSTGIVFISYFLIKKIFNKKVALLTSLAITLSWVYLFFTGRPLTSIPATFFLLTALLFFWKGYVEKQNRKSMIFFVIFFFLSIMTRFQNMMFIFPLVIFMFTKERFRFLRNKNLLLVTVIFILLLIPYFVLYYQNFGNPIVDIAGHYFGVGGERGANPSGLGARVLFDYFKDIPYILTGKTGSSAFIQPLFLLFLLGLCIYGFDLIIGFDKILKNEQLRRKFFVILWIVIPLFILAWVTGHVEQRYTMSIIPFFFAIISFSLLRLGGIISKKFNIKKNIITILVFVCLACLLIPNIIFANQLIEIKKTSYMEVQQAGEWIKENSMASDIIMSNSMPYMTYYAERSSYAIGKNETEFENKIKELNPRYLMLSIFERHEEWVFQYPEKHKDIMTSVYVYPPQSQQPVVVIYEFNYSN